VQPYRRSNHRVPVRLFINQFRGQERWIGLTFSEVFEREAEKLGIQGHLLGQGTIYPDTIETGGTKRADTIKTHHNRVPIIERMIAEGKVVEPLAELYKVEVRELGEKLGIPKDAIWRHPFPGPGLGVRLLCSDGHERETLASDLVHEIFEIGHRYGFDARPLPVKSVGVKADLRSLSIGLESYFVDNGAYPAQDSSDTSAHGANNYSDQEGEASGQRPPPPPLCVPDVDRYLGGVRSRKEIRDPHQLQEMLPGEPSPPLHDLVQHEGQVGVGAAEPQEGDSQEHPNQLSQGGR